MKTARRKRKFWIFTTTVECPVCGHEHVYRERRFSRKPKRAKSRFKFEIDASCGCIY